MVGEGKELDIGKFCSKMKLRGPIVNCLLKHLARKIKLKNVIPDVSNIILNSTGFLLKKKKENK